MERGIRKRSSAGSEKTERDSDRQEKMEGDCSTGQDPQWAVVPMEEEEDKEKEEEQEEDEGEEEILRCRSTKH
jgi:hypothetical protein